MQRDSEGSPYRRHKNKTEESGWNEGDEDESVDPFSSSRTKSSSIDRLRSWRLAALVLNASRRYRYTLGLKKEEEKQQTIRKIRAHVQATRAALLFQTAGKPIDVAALTPIPTSGYGIGPEQLHSMMTDHNDSALENYGGVKGLATMLKTDAEKGIQDEEADILHRLNVFGSNTYPHKEEKIFLRFLWDACRRTSLIILMVAAVASLVLGIKREAMKQGWYDGGSIALAVIISIIVTAVSDHRQSLEFQSLNKEKQKIDCEVIRGGLRQCVSIFDIVVGDVVHLRIGDMVPADGILISGFSLAIDESNMTGETRLVLKDLRSPFLMAGCYVKDGYGTMLVTDVGKSTEWGFLMASVSEDNGEETPLQVYMNEVATLVGTIGLVVAFGVFFVLMVRYFTGHTENPDGSVQFTAGQTRAADSGDEAVNIFTLAVTVAMIAVPERLPLAIISNLAYSVKKMMADKILVRGLSACELMGSATTICTNKTGTLTLNQMTVVEAFICEQKIEYPENTMSSIPPEVTKQLIEGIAQNTTGSVFTPESGEYIVVSGSPTDKAILYWGLALGMNFDAVRVSSSVIHAFLFNSEKKRGGVAVKLPDSKVHIHWKGDAEIVLDKCTRYIDANGCSVPMNEDKVTLLKNVIEDMAVRSLRCLALAFRSYELENIPSDEENLRDWDLPEDELVLLAVVGLEDPVRPGVKDAIQLCKSAGVKVRMVTGDNIQTARTIALECGILTDTEAIEQNIIEGSAFRALSDAEKLAIAGSILVMGSSSPNDKLMLVKALQKCEHVVAVIGDGSNDVPALHEADIGLAMGIQGTQVAKESSDIIILDDNFASVVKVIKWSRSLYGNILKFVQFQLTLNVAAVAINFVDAVSSGDVPYNEVQLLWVNVIMDTLGLLAMATERPTDNLMHRPPIGQRELITNIVWRNLVTQVVYEVIVLVVLNSQLRSMLNLEHDKSDHAAKVKSTFIFNVFIFCQIFNEFNARKPDGINVFKGITRNHFFIAIVSLTIMLQVIIITYLGKFTSSVRLGWKLWILSILVGFISLPLMTIAKFIPVPKVPFSKFKWRNYLRLRTLKGGERDLEMGRSHSHEP